MAETENPATTWPGGVVEITEGPWAGWRSWGVQDPFETMAGPFYWRLDPDGRPRCGLRAEAKHMNSLGLMHGGCLMTFADYAAFVFALEALGDDWAVTATFNAEFVGSARVGDLVEATGEVVRAGRSLVFIRGLITTEGGPALAFSAVAKKSPRRA